MSQSSEDLIASYMSQSPAAFMTVAIETGEPEVKDYNAPKNAEKEGGDGPCYGCCSERGFCKTPAQHIACALIVVGCIACCCYVTKGFGGNWTYWPF